MKKNKVLLFLYIISFLIIGKIHAQEKIVVFPKDTTRMIPDYLNVISISNPMSNNITIQLSTDKERWTNARFNSRETKLFALSKITNTCFCIITTTNNRKSKRILYKNNLYILFWDNNLNKWDIKLQ